MNLKVVLAIAGFVLLVEREAAAQIYSYPEEALAFSRTQAGGTARIRAMGGVQNSLGGDLSSAYYNPAGLGMYNRSDFSFTPGYTMTNNTADYLGTSTDASKSTFIVPNFGVAFHTNKDGTNGLWGGTFAVNFNRINDFNNTVTYQGKNSNNSIIDYFILAADGRDSTQFLSGNATTPEGVNYNTPTGLAWNNYLIGAYSDFIPGGSKIHYTSDVPFQDIFQDETIKTTGAQNQWSFSYGVNFNDKIFLGGGLGLTTLNYKTSVIYNETYTQYPLNKMKLQEDLSVSGSGINLTLGMIARPIDQLQLGFSMATPTSYNINETYSASMSSNWNPTYYYPGNNQNLKNISEQTDILTGTYTLNTPWRFSGGGTYFIQKHGFMSVDVEYISYGASRFSGKNGSDQDNSDIKDLYKSVLNIRLGGEYRVNKFRVRGGYSMMPDPYKTSPNGVDRTITSYTTGVGYREDKFYVDLALVYQKGNATHSPYPGSPNVGLTNSASSVILTVGFPFN